MVRRALLSSVLVLVLLAACGDDDGGDTASDDSTATTTTTEAAPATTTTTPPTTAEPTTSVSGAPCTEEAVLPAISAALDRPPDLVVTSVELTDCRNGYARALATAAGAVETEQVLLRDAGGSWEVISAGTGIDCADPGGLNEVDRAACEALGLS